MAPEVAKEQNYNETVDVFSFGILLWEMCSAEKPFYGYGSGKHMQQVVLGGERPKMDSNHTANWPNNLQWLIKKCWETSPSARPSFTMVKQVLKDILRGKECIPQDLEEHSEASEELPCTPPKRTGFFRSSRSRSDSVTKISSPTGSFKSVSPPDKARRARSWVFGPRR